MVQLTKEIIHYQIDLVENQLDEPVVEFAYQGPLLKLKNGKINFAISGDILFKIIRKNLDD